MRIRFSRKEALLFAATCDLYFPHARGDEPFFLEMNDRGELLLASDSGKYSIWHGYQHVDDLLDRMRKAGA